MKTSKSDAKVLAKAAKQELLSWGRFAKSIASEIDHALAAKAEKIRQEKRK